jgi:hypothetical protein
VSGLLPHVIRHTVTSKSVFVASESFGVVALTLLVVLLLERETLRIARAAPTRRMDLLVFSVPLLIAVALTIAARVARLIS